MLQPRMLTSNYYNFYEMDQYKTPPDLFASENDNDLLSPHHLNILLPDNRAWTKKTNMEEKLQESKVYEDWMQEFNQQVLLFRRAQLIFIIGHYRFACMCAYMLC